MKKSITRRQALTTLGVAAVTAGLPGAVKSEEPQGKIIGWMRIVTVRNLDGTLLITHEFAASDSQFHDYYHYKCPTDDNKIIRGSQLKLLNAKEYLEACSKAYHEYREKCSNAKEVDLVSERIVPVFDMQDRVEV